MKSNYIYTRKILGFDRRVWFTILTTIVVSVGLLSYRLTDKSCAPISFTVRSMLQSKGTVFAVGERISFNGSSKNINWNFGDNTAHQYGQYTDHVFETEGQYTVSAGSGYSCEPAHVLLTITAPLKLVEEKNVILTNVDAIQGSASAITGRSEYFTCKIAANFYEWSVISIPQSAKFGSTVNFSFPARGTYTIQVMLDNDPAKRFTKQVIAEDEKTNEVFRSAGGPPKEIPRLIPQEPALTELSRDAEATTTQAEAALPKSAKYIPDKVFKDYLEMVPSAQMTIADFDKYGITATTPVLANDDSKGGKNFAWLCNEIAKKKSGGVFGLGKKKSVKIASAQLQRINGAVSIILVKYSW